MLVATLLTNPIHIWYMQGGNTVAASVLVKLIAETVLTAYGPLLSVAHLRSMWEKSLRLKLTLISPSMEIGPSTLGSLNCVVQPKIYAVKKLAILVSGIMRRQVYRCLFRTR